MSRTIIIAEVGPNHNGSLKMAKKYVDVLKQIDVDYIKFQTSIPSDHISKYAEKAKYQKINTNKKKENQLSMAEKLSLKHSEFIQLKKYCTKKKAKFLTTALGIKSLNFVKKFNMDYIKVPSGEINNFHYLKNLPIKKKTKILLSTGMSNLYEINKAIKFLLKNGISKEKLIIMQCTTSYPVPYKEANLKFISLLKKKFKTKVGFSDHTLGSECAIAAIGFGAEYIEKHVTFNNNLKGPDHKASIEIASFKRMVEQIRNVDKAVGDGIKKIENSEKENKLIARNSIVARSEIKKNQLFTHKNLIIKRPGNGITPENISKIIGKKSNKNYSKDELIKIKGLK
jgi:N,N'-diacetyllegionaminate synthase